MSGHRACSATAPAHLPHPGPPQDIPPRTRTPNHPPNIPPPLEGARASAVPRNSRVADAYRSAEEPGPERAFFARLGGNDGVQPSSAAKAETTELPSSAPPTLSPIA